MSLNKTIEQPDWFASKTGDEPQEELSEDEIRHIPQQQRFEHELFRALTLAHEHNKSPVIRCTEEIYDKFMKKTANQIHAKWGVIMFRGIPIAMRDNKDSPHVVEVLDQNGKWSTAFKMERR